VCVVGNFPAGCGQPQIVAVHVLDDRAHPFRSVQSTVGRDADDMPDVEEVSGDHSEPSVEEVGSSGEMVLSRCHLKQDVFQIGRPTHGFAVVRMDQRTSENSSGHAARTISMFIRASSR
jgi:hypothetical protein